MKTSVACLAAALLAASFGPAQAACKLGQLQYNFDQVTETRMEIGPGEYCAGSFKFPNLRITRIEVPNQPRKGLVSVDQKTSVWKYRPFKDFRGEDFFALKIFAYNSRKTSDGTIVFRVRVQ